MPHVAIMKHRSAASTYLPTSLQYKIPPFVIKLRHCVYKLYLNWVCTVKSEVGVCDIKVSTGTEVTLPHHCGP